VLDQIDIDEICISMETIETYKSGNKDNYLKFLVDFINRLFKNVNITFDYNPRNENTLYYFPNENNFGKQCCLYDFYNFKTVPVDLPSNKYIILHTKCRFDRCMDSFLSNIPKIELFFKNFKSSHDIILLGEKEIDTKNPEVNIHNIQSIYNSFKNLNSTNNIIDLTRSNLCSGNNIDDFEKDIHIINNADCNICFGWGGPLMISQSFSKHTISYIDQLTRPEYFSYKYEGVNYHRDIDEFLNDITNKYSI
jgi:hypothetical protein